MLRPTKHRRANRVKANHNKLGFCNFQAQITNGKKLIKVANKAVFRHISHKKFLESHTPYLVKAKQNGSFNSLLFLFALSSKVKRLLDKAFGECDHKVCEKCEDRP
jgi:hypothetical protein